MPPAATIFTNPATMTTYRLVVTGDTWRVTKSREDNGQLRLAHLRGRAGSGPLDAAAMAHLVAGTGGQTSGAMDPSAVFATVVLLDLDRTADLVVAITHEAEEVYQIGCPGFRPRSPTLRRQRDAALRHATATCRDLAVAWRASNLIAPGEIPAWLYAALMDED